MIFAMIYAARTIPNLHEISLATLDKLNPMTLNSSVSFSDSQRSRRPTTLSNAVPLQRTRLMLLFLLSQRSRNPITFYGARGSANIYLQVQFMRIKLQQRSNRSTIISQNPTPQRVRYATLNHIDEAKNPAKIEQYLEFMRSALAKTNLLKPTEYSFKQTHIQTQGSENQENSKIPIKYQRIRFHPNWREKLLRRKNFGSYGQIIKGNSKISHQQLMKKSQKEATEPESSRQFMPMGAQYSREKENKSENCESIEKICVAGTVAGKYQKKLKYRIDLSCQKTESCKKRGLTHETAANQFFKRCSVSYREAGFTPWGIE